VTQRARGSCRGTSRIDGKGVTREGRVFKKGDASISACQKGRRSITKQGNCTADKKNARMVIKAEEIVKWKARRGDKQEGREKSVVSKSRPWGMGKGLCRDE